MLFGVLGESFSTLNRLDEVCVRVQPSGRPPPAGCATDTPVPGEELVGGSASLIVTI